jgi:glyceraldehyde 3-phosphate dehydrogenase
VSLVDLTLTLTRPATVDAINAAMKAAAESEFKGVMSAVEEPLVSIDFLSETHSSCVDLGCTMMMGDKSAKILAWYDNEMGYSARLWDMCLMVGEKL